MEENTSKEHRKLLFKHEQYAIERVLQLTTSDKKIQKFELPKEQ